MEKDLTKDLLPEAELSAEYKVRVEKVKQLREQGIEPWPAARVVKATCQEVIDQFKPEQEQHYTIAGRLLTLRAHGQTAFGTIQDRSGRLQVYIRKDQVGEQKFAFLNDYIDLGDILWFEGSSFTTKTGEITLKVEDFALLSKSLFPLPEKFHGLADVEVRYRQRYLDLITSPESKEKFLIRSRIIRQLRSFLDAHDFVEVETPMLHPIAGGAAARPFITHHNALDADFYLRIAPELYLKRLVVGGIERVYEINRNFRNEGISTRHNPEFTMIEFYMAHQDYHFVMNLVEELLRTIVQVTNNATTVTFGNHTIDFDKPFKRTSAKNALLELTDYKEADLAPEAIDALLKKHSIKVAKNASYGQKIFLLFEELAEHKLIQPTFIIDFPIEISPLAKRDANNPEIAARFELFIGAMEIANGFNELNDPFDQAERFHEQVAAHASGDEEAHQYDADFILALQHALPPTVGCGIGIDRLVMLMTDTTSIKDIILFPTLKRK